MKLLEPIKLGNVTLKNRIMFPPLSTGYEERDGSIGPRSFNFYTRLAQGGVGYIVIGDVSPVATISPTPRLYMDSQAESFKRLADSVHQYGSKIAVQIFHPEYDCEGVTKRVLETWGLFGQVKKLQAEGKNEEAAALNLKAIECQRAAFGYLHQSTATFANQCTKAELDAITEKIKACAVRAIEAGFDGIEIHGDRLVGSLCSTRLNQRTDEYGGSFENRIRYALEVTDAIRSISPDIIVEYKMPVITLDDNGNPVGKGGLFLEEAVELAKILETRGVNAIHVGQANHTGNNNDTIPAMGTRRYTFMNECAKAIKKAVSIPVSLAGRVININNAEALIEEGTCDYVSFGRSLLCDPDMANKLAAGKGNEIRQCMMCNKGCTDAIAGKGAYKWVSCVLNAENGFEGERHLNPITAKKRVAVAGAGIAGLEAARVLALRGHEVEIYEKGFSIGGQINIASVPPRKEEMRRAINFFEEILPTLGVKFHFGHEFTKEDAANYDDVIVAIGAHNLVPGIPGIKGSNVANAWDVLANKANPFGKIVVCGGGLVGAETAEYLANKGYAVTVVEMLDAIAKEESPTILPTMMQDFKDHNVELLTKTKIVEITANGVVVDCLDKDNNPTERKTLECDFVVNALASAKNTIDLEGVKANIHYVGDQEGQRPSNIDHAIKSAYDAANLI